MVLPKADVKIYLTASDEVRANRRLKELLDQGQKTNLDTVLREIRQRDQQDLTRAIAPLRQAKDAVVADTSTLNLEESLALLERIVQEKIGQ